MNSLLIKRIGFVAGALLALCACTALPENPPLAKYDPAAGYRFDQLEHANNSDSLFVIVTFSGGGTRAAALAYGVLEALRDTTIDWQGRKTSLLDEVDVISSISGGSFPAAYFALRGRKTFAEFPDKFLYRPIQSALLRQVALPQNLVKLARPAYGRSDLAAEFYDREVFGGATYATVIARKQRPFVILNATDMSTGASFPFIQDQFDLLCSDLAGVSLARAAAASSAFPGGLTPLTFKNYAGTCQYRQAPWVELALRDHASRLNRSRTARAEQRLSFTDAAQSRRYIHLTDGGVGDNIGLRGPLTAITGGNSAWSVLQLMNQQKVDKLVVIVVNAATNPATDRDKKAAVPGLLDTLTTAATVPLDNFSSDTLDMLSATVNAFNEESRLVAGCEKIMASARQKCTVNIAAPHPVEFYPIQVAFDYIAAATERDRFKNLPTNFDLPRATVDQLRAVGRRLLAEDPQFRRLLGALHGCIAEAGQNC